jgi:endoglucanase
MKKILLSCTLILTGVVIINSCRINNSKQLSQNMVPQEFVISSGINLSHWLSQVPTSWNMDRDKFITQSDIQQIAEFGFDHVRIPVDEEEMWTESGEPIESSFQYLTNCLDWCQAEGLRAIVDLHILRSHHFNAQNNEGKITLWSDTVAQDNFIALWEELSSRLREYPVSVVAYEIMNEPVADDPEDWNILAARAMKVIRVNEPDRVIVIGANKWQTAANFPFLKVPEGDTNIILGLHTYDPITITHYKAGWNPMRDYDGPVQYPGLPVQPEDILQYTKAGSETRKFIEDANKFYNRDTLESIIQPAIDKAEELGLKLYCGEFGCLPTIPREMRLQYYRDITDVFIKNDIAYAAWDYKGDFAIVPYDRENSASLEPDKELIEILVGYRVLE